MRRLAERVRRGLQFLEGEFGQELLRGHLVVIAAIGPEELGEVRDLAQHLRLDALRMGHDRFQQPFLPQAEAGDLIVDDGIDGDGRLRQPVRERLFLGVERLKLSASSCTKPVEPTRPPASWIRQPAPRSSRRSP